MRLSILIVARHPRATLGIAQAMLKFGYQILTAYPDEPELQRVRGACPSVVVLQPPSDHEDRRRCLGLIKTLFLDHAMPVVACVRDRSEVGEVKNALGEVAVVAGSPLRFNDLYARIQEMLKLARRRELRITTETIVAHREPELSAAEHYFYDTMTSLSMGGCFVRTDSPYPLEADVELLFCIGSGSESLALAGKVRRHGDGDEPGMGVEFQDLAEKDRARLGSFLMSQLGTADLPSGI